MTEGMNTSSNVISIVLNMSSFLEIRVWYPKDHLQYTIFNHVDDSFSNSYWMSEKCLKKYFVAK
jgi:hypothetical protein